MVTTTISHQLERRRHADSPMCAWPMSKHNRRSRRCVSFTNFASDLWRAELVGRVFHAIVTPRCFAKTLRSSSDLNAASILRGSDCRRGVPHMLHEVAEGNSLRNFERALHFVNRILRRMRSGSEIEMGALLSRPCGEFRSVGECSECNSRLYSGERHRQAREPSAAIR